MPSEYYELFGLRESPFVRDRDPRWLCLTAQQREAALRARWVVAEHAGIALLCGAPGCGRSSVLDYLMRAWTDRFGWRCARLPDPPGVTSPRLFLHHVLSAFGLAPAATLRKMADNLHAWLLWEEVGGPHTIVLLIDRAEAIAQRALPLVDDLASLREAGRPLLHVVLAGGPRAVGRLSGSATPVLSLGSLGPIGSAEADAILVHRLREAGAADPFSVYSPHAVRALHAYSGGVPADMLAIAEVAMREAFLRESPRIEPEHVEEAIRTLAGLSGYIPIFRAEPLPSFRPARALRAAGFARRGLAVAYSRAA